MLTCTTAIARINTTKQTNNQLLHTKSDKLEQLVKLKDAKIAALMGRLSAAGLTA